MNEKETETALSRAIAHLIKEKVIEKDGDLVDKLGYSKGTISAYRSGHTRPSKKFIAKFENFSKLKLSDFEIKNDYGVSKSLSFSANDDGGEYFKFTKLMSVVERQQQLVDNQQQLVERQHSTIHMQEETIQLLVKGMLDGSRQAS